MESQVNSRKIERKYFWNKLGKLAPVESAVDQQADIVDHVLVRNEIEEFGKVAARVIAHVLELSNHLVSQTGRNEG